MKKKSYNIDTRKLGFKLIKRQKDYSVYYKYDPLSMTEHWLEFDHKEKTVTASNKVSPHVANEIVKLNKNAQTHFDKYDKDALKMQTRIPETMFQQLKEQSGWEAHTGLWDKKKASAILDDPDYKYLKTTPHKLSGRLREI